MNNDKHKSKIENDNTSRCRVERSQYKFDIVYLPGKENVAADALNHKGPLLKEYYPFNL